MDLTIPVKLKNKTMSFDEFTRSLEREQASSLDYLKNPESGWHVPGSLEAKVDQKGKLKPFFGDTVTIPIDDGDVPGIRHRLEFLHSGIKELLAEPLLAEHFHLTLHDLDNGPDQYAIMNKMEENREKCSEIFKKVAGYFRNNPDNTKIKMVSTHPYPCCNISVILGFAPATDKDYRTLMNLYNLFDDVVYLDYWLRPHVTLCYFKPLMFTKAQMELLHKKLMELDRNKIAITLDLWKSAYQRFTDMNNYTALFSILDFR